MSKLSLAPHSITGFTQGPASLHVQWDDGHTTTFHYVWLRDNSPQARDAHGQRLHDASDIQVDVHPWSVKILDDGGLEILWAQAEHRSYYSATWLRSHTHSTRFQTLSSFKGTATRTSRPELWTGRVINKHMLTVSFDALLLNPLRKANWLASLMQYGVSIVSGVGTRPGDIENVVKFVGTIRETQCGRIFDVKSDHSAGNELFRGRRHSVYTAMPYRDPVPAFQSLHCLSGNGNEGDCIFVDGYFVSGLLRRKFPEMFLLLCAFPAPFIWFDRQHDLFMERPVITTNFRGEVTSIHFNHRAAGPFQVPPTTMGSYYEAYRTFDALVNDPNHQIRFTLEPGEVVVFDNLRILQGEFGVNDLRSGHMQSCYVDFSGGGCEPLP